MTIHQVLRLTQRRSFVTTLFGMTFVAACLTVSASNLLPCPVRPERGRFADGEVHGTGAIEVVPAKRTSRRWIEEKVPGSA